MTDLRVAADFDVIEHVDARQRWLVSWHPAGAPPPLGTGHGSAAVCITSDEFVVLVRERDTDNWQIPGGRPEGNESWRETLDREVLEEACANVADATLLGFVRSECVEGGQQGTVLIRAMWRAAVHLLAWEPRFEMVERRLFTPQQALEVGIWNRSLAPIYRRLFSDGLGGLAPRVTP